MKNLIKYILLSTFYFLLFSTKAQDSKALFQTANTYYQNKQFEEAEKMYLLILKKDNNNANARFNLGNTYFHLEDYTNAILNYEKAKKLQPDDKTIQHNIDLTNNKLFSKIEFSKEFFVAKQIKNTVHSKSSKGWSIYMLVALWLCVILACIYFFTTNKFSYKVGIITFLGTILFAYFTYSAYENEHQQNFAIVTKDKTPLKNAPVADGDTNTTIQTGIKVEIIDNDKNWRKVKLPNGKTGWIDISQMELI